MIKLSKLLLLLFVFTTLYAAVANADVPGLAELCPGLKSPGKCTDKQATELFTRLLYLSKTFQPTLYADYVDVDMFSNIRDEPSLTYEDLQHLIVVESQISSNITKIIKSNAELYQISAALIGSNFCQECGKVEHAQISKTNLDKYQESYNKFNSELSIAFENVLTIIGKSSKLTSNDDVNKKIDSILGKILTITTNSGSEISENIISEAAFMKFIANLRSVKFDPKTISYQPINVTELVVSDNDAYYDAFASKLSNSVYKSYFARNMNSMSYHRYPPTAVNNTAYAATLENMYLSAKPLFAKAEHSLCGTDLADFSCGAGYDMFTNYVNNKTTSLFGSSDIISQLKNLASKQCNGLDKIYSSICSKYDKADLSDFAKLLSGMVNATQSYVKEMNQLETDLYCTSCNAIKFDIFNPKVNSTQFNSLVSSNEAYVKAILSLLGGSKISSDLIKDYVSQSGIPSAHNAIARLTQLSDDKMDAFLTKLNNNQFLTATSLNHLFENIDMFDDIMTDIFSVPLNLYYGNVSVIKAA